MSAQRGGLAARDHRQAAAIGHAYARENPDGRHHGRAGEGDGNDRQIRAAVGFGVRTPHPDLATDRLLPRRFFAANRERWIRHGHAVVAPLSDIRPTDGFGA